MNQASTDGLDDIIDLLRSFTEIKNVHRDKEDIVTHTGLDASLGIPVDAFH